MAEASRIRTHMEVRGGHGPVVGGRFDDCGSGPVVTAS